MAVETTENVDVAEIPEVTVNSAIGEGETAISADICSLVLKDLRYKK